jgi:uncharacterized protein YcnI
MLRRMAVFLGVVMIGIAASALPAWAHVTVDPTSAEKGGSDVEIAFRVPNEESTASVTKLQVSVPTDPPLLSVLAQYVAGWTSNVVTQHLAKPIQTDDGPVSDVVSEVTWTADNPAAQIKPDAFGKFEIIVGSLPSTGDQIVFRSIQTYSNGDVVRWIELQTPGGPEPEHPAPIVQLTNGASSAGSTTPITTAGSASELPSHVASTSDTNTAKTLGIIAIVLAVLALIGVAILLFRKRPA